MGPPRNRQSGPQPSATSKATSRAGGMAARTSSVRRRKAANAPASSVIVSPKVWFSIISTPTDSSIAATCGGSGKRARSAASLAMVAEKLFHHASSGRTVSTTFG